MKKNIFNKAYIFPGGSVVKNSPANAGDTWEIPWIEEPGGLQSLGLQKLDMT